MTRRGSWFLCGWVVAGVTALAFFAGPSVRAEERAKPDVALIVLDTLRADSLNAERNGVQLMPNLRRFAEGSVHFTDAISPCSWTRPAIASLFTSLYVDTHGVRYSDDPSDPKVKSDALPKTIETMASFLKKAGYATTGIQTNPHAHDKLGFAQGFDTYEFENDAKADWVTARALELAKAAEGPHFLFVHYLDTHEPYAPPDRYRKQLGFPDKLNETDTSWVTEFVPCVTDKGYFMIGRKPKREYADPSPVGMEAVKTLYDGEAKFLDDELGKLLAYLDERRDNTIVVIVTDHGEEFWDHGFLLHSLTLYEEQVHVPFILRAPGIEPRRVDETVETIDVLPTVAGLLGMPPNPVWQGRSLFSDGREVQRPAFSTTRTLWPTLHMHIDQVQFRRWKLIVDRMTGAEMLFNLAVDPGETANLAAQEPARAKELRALLDRHNKQNAARAEALGNPDSVEIDGELKEKLRSLGYF